MKVEVTRTHTFSARIIHWTFIFLYAYGIFKQLDDISELENSRLLVFEVFFASIFLIIVMMRYFYMRRFETFLGAREPIPSAHRYLAKTIHTSMYLCLIILPLSGLLIAGLFTQGIVDGPMQDLVIEIHGFSADLSYFLIVIHICAAIYSRIKGEGVWTSMVPIWKENKSLTNETIIKVKNLENKFFEKVEDFFSTPK
ncbi:MAG: cytochrome b/b6 domain-containing protein [Candidatus Thalassarchaeaceae archaeon]